MCLKTPMKAVMLSDQAFGTIVQSNAHHLRPLVLPYPQISTTIRLIMASEAPQCPSLSPHRSEWLIRRLNSLLVLRRVQGHVFRFKEKGTRTVLSIYSLVMHPVAVFQSKHTRCQAPSTICRVLRKNRTRMLSLRQPSAITRTV